MSTRVCVDNYERVMDDRGRDTRDTRDTRDNFAHAHVMVEPQSINIINNNNNNNNQHASSHSHPQNAGGDGMQNLIHTFKKFSFPSMDEYTRIELEQDRRRKSSTERPKSGAYPSEFHIHHQNHSGGYTMDGGEVRRRKSREYLVADDDDEDNFMILSTREHRDNIVVRDEYNILNDDLKERRRSQNFDDREEFPVTMVPICDIDYISGQPENVENVMWRQQRGSGVHREYTEIEHTETRSKANQTASGNQERKSSKTTSFMSKNEVRDLLREFNEDYRRNTEVLIKEMRESTSSLIRNFQETVTFSFREITSTLKEMEEQNNRMNMRNNDVLSEDVELLYNKIMEDNQEIKLLVANLINAPINKKNVDCDDCEDSEKVRRKSSLGPEEKIKDMEVRFDRVTDACKVDPIPVTQKVSPPTEGRLDDYICEIVVCPQTTGADVTECANALTGSVEMRKSLSNSVEVAAQALTASMEGAQVLSGSYEGARVLSGSYEGARVLSSSHEGARVLSGSYECPQALTASVEFARASEAEMNAKNATVQSEAQQTVQQAACVKANICEVKEKLDELRRKSVEKLVTVERVTQNCASEDDWFKNLKTIHKSVHNGI